MSNPFDYNRLSRYIATMVDRKTKAVTIGITGAVGFLQGFVDRAKTQAEISTNQAGISKAQAMISEAQAQQAQGFALSADTIRHILYKLYVGVNDVDPVRSALNDVIADQAFGIRSSDGRLRYARVSNQGVITWQDATVPADRQSVIDIAKGLLLFLDSADLQTVKGRVVFSNSVGFTTPPTGPQVVDFTTAAIPNAKSIDDHISDRLRSLIPTRTIVTYFGGVAPTGWAMCDGGTYPLSDGTGTITTPDLRGRVVVGAGDVRVFGVPFGSDTSTADTSINTTNASVTTGVRQVDAGGSANGIVNRVTYTDPGHHHSVSVDVNQPSLALSYIMKL